MDDDVTATPPTGDALASAAPTSEAPPSAPRQVVRVVRTVPSAARVVASPVEEPKPASLLRNIIEWVAIIGFGVAAVVLIQMFVFKTFFVPSGSMEPTLQPGDRVVVSKLDHNYQRGNIVVFNTPPGEVKACGPSDANQLIKRIIGLPGETISSRGDQVLINGQPLPQPWFPAAPLGQPIKTTDIPKNEYYVMGDNRAHSCDSRYWGPIAKQSIIGKVVFRIWPVSKMGSVK